MKTNLFLIVTMLPLLCIAGIMPEAGEKMPKKERIVTCVFEDRKLDFTEINFNKKGDMVFTVNPKYVKGSNRSPYVLYKGMNIVEENNKTTIQGTILTLGGEEEVHIVLDNFKVPNKLVVFDEFLSCTAWAGVITYKNER